MHLNMSALYGIPISRPSEVVKVAIDCGAPTWNGLCIVANPLAREVRTEYRVTAWATRDKKRKNWRVLRVTIDRPGMYRMGDTLVVHPELMPKLIAAATVAGGEG